MPVGTVKWFDCKKGFGFLVDAHGQDVFIHYSIIEGDGFRRLHDGEKVEYDHAQGPKGLSATRVKRLDPSLDGQVPPALDGKPINPLVNAELDGHPAEGKPNAQSRAEAHEDPLPQ